MVNLNLVDVPIPVVAKAVIADTFGWTYTLDDRVTGNITLQTGTAVKREELLALFESALGSHGAILRRRGNAVQILPASASAGIRTLQATSDTPSEPGSRAQVISLRWIAATEMQSILGAVAPRDVVLRVDQPRNLLIVSGDQAQIDALREAVAVFDVDWMRGMSTAIVPIASSSPEAITKTLIEIFGGEASGPGAVIRFVPNEALGAILVITPRATYLDRARSIIANLETVAAGQERQIFVYHIQNRTAKELAAVLQGVIAAEQSGSSMGGSAYGAGGLAGGSSSELTGSGLAAMSSSSAGIGRGLDTSGAGAGIGVGGQGGTDASAGSGFGASSGAAGITGSGGLGGGSSNLSSTRQSAMSGGLDSASSANEGGAYGGSDSASRRGGAIAVIADESNNSLVISATRNEYDKLLRVLERLDAMPTQVLLETVIAEVDLNDSLQFGVQWFLQNGQSQLNLASAATAAAATAGTGGTAGLIAAAGSGSSGFSYLLSNSNFNVVLSALNGITKVHVISSPSITVLDNHTARLQVGDQVPIVQETGQSALVTGAPVLNQIVMKDTGVILAVTPRVNKNGLVVLDISQEVSDVVPTTTSTINSPTIRQRKIATSVAVNDGHSLALGGLVQEKRQIETDSVPVLGNLPVVGAAFRNRSDIKTRTELIVFIRPRVMRGTVDADRITSDFRQNLRVMMPARPVPRSRPLEPAPDGMSGLRQRIFD